MLTTAISGGMLYSRTDNPRVLAATILASFPIPFNILFMRPNIKALESSSNADPKVQDLADTWAKLHAMRTVFGLASFSMTIFSLLTYINHLIYAFI